MPDENDTSQKAKSGVLASVRASVGALSLRAMREDDLLLLVGGEELQKLLQTLPEQPHG